MSNPKSGCFGVFGKFRKFTWTFSTDGNSLSFEGLNDFLYFRRFEKYLGLSLLTGSLIFILLELRLKLKLLLVIGDIYGIAFTDLEGCSLLIGSSISFIFLRLFAYLLATSRGRSTIGSPVIDGSIFTNTFFLGGFDSGGNGLYWEGFWSRVICSVSFTTSLFVLEFKITGTRVGDLMIWSLRTSFFEGRGRESCSIFWARGEIYSRVSVV